MYTCLVVWLISKLHPIRVMCTQILPYFDNLLTILTNYQGNNKLYDTNSSKILKDKQHHKETWTSECRNMIDSWNLWKSDQILNGYSVKNTCTVYTVCCFHNRKASSVHFHPLLLGQMLRVWLFSYTILILGNWSKFELVTSLIRIYWTSAIKVTYISTHT